MKIGYIVHDLNDPSIERRCLMLNRGGADVVLVGFFRGEHLSPRLAQWKPYVLGQSTDAAFIKRTTKTVQKILLIDNLRKHLADCDVIMARNLEQLGIAKRVVGNRKLIYECLDIHRLLLETSVMAKCVQFVESKLLPRVNLLLTSSPAFLREHFEHSSLAAPTYLIENKLLVADSDVALPLPAAPKMPLRIGWFGMLRCRKTFEFLTELVRRSDGRIEVLICGKPSVSELPDFEQQIKQIPSMNYKGPYTYSDLPNLYGQCHFAWTIDWFEEGLNSSWLLPNRLYEALSNGVVPIALSNIELGRWLNSEKVGFVVANPDEAMNGLLSMTVQDITRLQQAALKMDPTKIRADTTDCKALVEKIGQDELL